MSDKHKVSITSSEARDFIREEWGEYGDGKEFTVIDDPHAPYFGKLLIRVRFMPYEYVILDFADGTSMTVEQTSQTGDLRIVMEGSDEA